MGKSIVKKDLKNLFDDQTESDGFIKVTDSPVPLSSDKKVILNRKGNIYFNNGDLLSARRIFITTGYSDGLIRVGDEYLKKGNELQALKMYWLAHSKNKCQPLLEKLAHTISTLLKEED